MPSIFTRIIAGEIPGRFVWKDEECVAFVSNGPLRPGHTLVVPRREIDHWLDLEPALAGRLMAVAQIVGKAIQTAFRPEKVGLMIAGLEVRHVHIHLVPIREIHDLDFERQDRNPDPAALDASAEAIRRELRQAGHTPAS